MMLGYSRFKVDWVICLCALSAVFLMMNAYVPGLGGDPFREARIEMAVLALAPIGARFIAKDYGWALACVWAWSAVWWAILGRDAYGYEEVVFPIAMAALVCLLRGREAAVWIALRVTFLLQAILAVLQVLGAGGPLTIVLRGFDFPGHGTMGNPTLLGAFLSALVPWAWMRWSRLEAAIGMVAVLSCNSTMACAALGLSAVVALWKASRREWAFGFMFAGGAALTAAWALKPGISFLSVNGRHLPWAAAWRGILERPFMGWGPGSWAGLYPHWKIDYPGTWLQVHSDWLQLAHSLGLPAAIFALFVVIWRATRERDPARAAVIIALAVNAGGNFPFRFLPTAFLFCLAFSSSHRGR